MPNSRTTIPSTLQAIFFMVLLIFIYSLFFVSLIYEVISFLVFSKRKKIKKRYSGEGPCARTITRYANQYHLVDSSPLKVGKPSEIPDHAFGSLCVGLESYISIIQNNKRNHKLEKKKLAALVNSVIGRSRELTDKHTGSYKLLSRIAKWKKIDFNAIKLSTQEARRIQWTKRKYLQMWFDTWEASLIKLGFAKRSEVDGHIEIPDDQLARILNFDETCLSLDGSGSAAGGRPSAILSWKRS